MIGIVMFFTALFMLVIGFPVAFTFAAVTSLGGLSFVTFNVPFQKLIYKNAKKTGPLFILRRELYLNVGRISILLFAMAVYFFSGSIVVASISCFIVGSIATLFLNFID